ncbi:MAG TPA: alpha/beta hydrolase [Burkholderiales bacterium]|nr:alpha/beta hydrolase [Burkholderiales bacterium]
MDTAPRVSYEIDVTDVEYIKHGSKAYLARVYKPKGKGPFPLLIDIHGGAWVNKDRLADEGTDAPLAKTGVVVASLDFRMPPDGGYPASLQDINYAIRWFKSRAAEFNIDPKRVGVLGVSSGGHQAMLTAMRPNDYADIAGPAGVDASVKCAVMCWPVIDPLGRYEYAQGLKGGQHDKQATNWVASHDRYWGGTEAQAKANPTRLLERGEQAQIVPVVYLQGTADLAHPVPNRERFIASYRKAGGKVDLHLFEGVGEAFITNDPNSSQAKSAVEKIIDFVHRELG